MIFLIPLERIKRPLNEVEVFVVGLTIKKTLSSLIFAGKEKRTESVNHLGPTECTPAAEGVF